MKLGPLTYLTIGFLSIVLLRLGLTFETSEILMAFAASDAASEDISATDTTPNDNNKNNKSENIPSETITKKLNDPKGFKKDTAPDNDFAVEDTKINSEKNPETVCITGPMVRAATQKLEYLKKREEEIAEQSRLIEIADRRVREQVAKLTLMKEEIIENAQLADSKIQKESKRLISIYEKMNPKKAAEIFNEMNPALAAELLRTMKEDQSSAILAAMSPQNAYNVTLALSGGIQTSKEKHQQLKK